jgi:hypothetical protein
MMKKLNSEKVMLVIGLVFLIGIGVACSPKAREEIQKKSNVLFFFTN